MSSEQRVRFAIAEQAAGWFIRHRTEELNATERGAFDAWLAESPVHIEEYLGIAQLTQDLPFAAVGPAFDVERLVKQTSIDESIDLDFTAPRATSEAARERAYPVRRAALAAMAAMLVVIGIGLYWWSGYQGVTERFATQHGEQRTWQLADRTVLQLNTDTVVTVRYSRRTRRVDILEGQAYFEVVHDESRPFLVDAGIARITDLGTNFDVYRKDDSTTVTVVEGRVAVDTAGGSVHAKAGEQVNASVDASSPTLRSVDVRRSTAWRNHRIAFDQKPLGEVVAEFNRYGTVPIVIESPSLAGLHVSGVVSTDDTSSFVAFLRSIKNVDVNVGATRIRVSQRSPDTLPDRKRLMPPRQR